ncbi:hypothetical protein [Microbulbifer taiwanensis]|uniref:Transmembrane protein n=1 Tax=Microbulbifer taiwanensis TaxID=986746 RepID=A0ABW1YS67_9GAMM|nr:hypothetical protein [Microbulbifer taiwanensis]
MQFNQDLPVVAGHAAGKRIRCTTDLMPTYQRLKDAADRGNHWPRIALRELNALTSGMLDKKNVYVRPGKPDYYVVFLPGIKATVKRWTNDQYCITDMDLDERYFEATSQENTRMGLYRVAPPKGDEGWTAKYVQGGRVAPKAGRMVTVSDAGYSSADHAARAVIPRAIKAPDVAGASVRNGGCDLHFTPGKKLGSLIRYNALNNDQCRGSALHLAYSMAQARDIKDVIWLADSGGSLVLTQAMKILVDQGVTLKGHTAYLAKATSSPGQAVRLAHRLEMTLNEDFADTGLSPRGAFSQWRAAGARFADEHDAYDRERHADAWVSGAGKVAAPVGAVAFAGGLMGASVPVIASMSAIAGAVGFVGVWHNIGKSLVSKVRDKELKR